MVRSALSNVAGCIDDVEILLGIDDDDPKRAAYRSCVKGLGRWESRVKVFEFAGMTVSEIWNALFGQSLGEVIMLGNDDLVFETRGWDRAFLDVHFSVPDGVYVAWAQDRINGGRHAAFPVVSRSWVRHLGYFAPRAGFKFWYNDTWIYEIGKMVGRLRYLPGVAIRHLHFTAGGVEDETTRRNRSGDQPRHDRELFVRTMAQREVDAEILKAAMRSYAEACS